MNDLSKAYATQLDGGPDGKSEWVVYNENKEEIYRLPMHWNESEVMAAIHFGRKFELIAFNEGIEFQKGLAPTEIKSLRAIVKNLEAEKMVLKAEVNKLGTALDTWVAEEELR